jgi:hypothetical protein
MTRDPLWDYYDQAAMEALTAHRYTKASRIVKDGLQKARQMGEFQPGLLARADELASVYRASGDYTSAASIYRLMEDLQRATLGAEHPAVVSSHRHLMSVLKESGCITPGNA